MIRSTSIILRPHERRRVEAIRTYLIARRGPGSTVSMATAVRWALRLAARHVRREVRTRRQRRGKESGK